MSACVAPEEDPPSHIETSCEPERVEPYIGKNISTLPADITDGHVRIIPPDTAVTMDYWPSRLNIITDKNGIIEKAHCG